ncbi:hypothetical protein NW762_013095 [Fusarium torreyae]|uniref:PRISE-like Rossmann-fold domain-containing protein n=1 Tax=Fusarium torreyae TaxID=1237075 RepID=A0A9W8VAP3_9HYPO|nr:hypothetical protein NW762_013095 [Fusarium torreyae]
MSSENFPLRQSGIYRNLPSFDPSIQRLNAVICGANGISGFNTLRALLDSPQRWSNIYALSRSPPTQGQLNLVDPELRSRIKHISLDLGAPAHEIKNALVSAGVAADYIFYYTYVQPSSDRKSGMDASMAQDLYDANVPLFDNFLNALELAEVFPKRILLQTGGKNYGMHIGRVRTPLVESDPQPRHLQPNFYYGQEDRLKKFCKDHPQTSWNMIRPAAIIGSSPRAQIDTFYPFAAYAAIQAKKGEPLKFGGDFSSWQYEALHSTALLTGFLSEWAVLEDKCANQAFNAQDGQGLSWDRFFEELARWYGVEKGVVPPNTNSEDLSITKFAGGRDAPLGYGPPLTVSYSFQMKEWFADPENRKQWRTIMNDSHGRITVDVTENSDLVMGDFAYLDFGSLSMAKGRRFGWTGFVDPLESIFQMYEEMASFGMLPKMVVSAPRPLV